ncbi:MAG: GGDEF domain-containing protein [Campylobacterales bacterium]|nr:GGDEF domain-containing protein [Campylobacterales bacterium]
MKSIQFKIILSILLFVLFIIGLERYQLSKSIRTQFIEFKKSKNELLMNTIIPVISLNLSLGLESANDEYLESIVTQNSDLVYVRLLDNNGNLLYEFESKTLKDIDEIKDFNHCEKSINDTITDASLGVLELQFSNSEYEQMHSTNERIGLQITIISIVLLLLFLLFLKHVFKGLAVLTQSVLEYNPKENNFKLRQSPKKDEVSLIQNAIVEMVNRIAIYAEVLDNTNALLEEKVRQRTLELEESNKELKLLASVDPLTGLYNRRYFTKSSEQILEIVKRNKTALSTIMLDIDNFKNVNDTYGHKCGDDVIVSVATIVNDSIRKSDIACRFGGEEFVVLLPETDIEGAYIIAEKIRKKVEEKRVVIEGGFYINVSVSVGVTEYNLKKDINFESIIHRADRAMYSSKESGKNQTSVHSA